MSTASVQIWRDTGYTEGCLEVPKPSASLLNPDFTFNNLEISRGFLFSEVKVRHAFEDLFDCAYLKISIDMNNGDDVVVYGWIDAVECSSDTAGSPMTVIRWHPDLWRTWISKVSIGSGMVMRRPSSGDLPPQPYEPRFRTAEGIDDWRTLIPMDSVLWVVFRFTANVADVSIIGTGCFPVSRSSPSTNLQISGVPFGTTSTDTVTKIAPSMDELARGVFDEALGLDPDAVKGVWISFLPPASFGSGAPYSNGNWHVIQHNDYGYLFKWDFTQSTYSTTKSLTGVETSDTESYVVTDYNGDVIATLPWGLSVDRATSRLVLTTSEAYTETRFYSSTETGKVYASPLEGLTVRVPLPILDLTANSYSSYVYSGARSAEIQQRATDRRLELANGLASSLSAGAEGGMAGGMMAAMGSSSIAQGMGIGAATSAAGRILSSGAQFAAGSMMDGMVQRSIDRVRSAQTQAMVFSGCGFDFIYNIKSGIELVKMEWDPYSVTQRSQDMSLYGAHVQEPRTSCQSLITAGGPVQIINATVTGNAPQEAKQYIRARLAQGVRIV